MKKALADTTGYDLPHETYRLLMSVSPICTISIMFFNQEKTHTLLGRRTNEPYKGSFFAFGGRLRKHETFEDATVRIAKQETGIVLSPKSVTFAGVLNEMNPGSKFEGIDYHSVDVYFACIIPSDTKIELDSQHDEYRWFNTEDQTLHINIKKRIRDSLAVL